MKKKKFTLFLIAVALLLTGYYYKIYSREPEGEPLAPISSTRYDDFVLLRDSIIASRTEELDRLSKVLEEDQSMETKLIAVDNMREISSLTEAELSFEHVIKNLGFEDALVHVTNNMVNIQVLNEDFTLEDSVEIMTLSKTYFANEYKVSISHINNTK